jgi:hypothetical protein
MALGLHTTSAKSLISRLDFEDIAMRTFNFLGSHTTDRPLTRLESDSEKLGTNGKYHALRPQEIDTHAS